MKSEKNNTNSLAYFESLLKNSPHKLIYEEIASIATNQYNLAKNLSKSLKIEKPFAIKYQESLNEINQLINKKLLPNLQDHKSCNAADDEHDIIPMETGLKQERSHPFTGLLKEIIITNQKEILTKHRKNASQYVWTILQELVQEDHPTVIDITDWNEHDAHIIYRTRSEKEKRMRQNSFQSRVSEILKEL